MISSQVALDTILDNTQDFGTEEVSFLDALGRVLKEDIVADRDFPPFDRVSMDGIAINYTAFAEGKRDFATEGIQAAGSPQLTLQDQENCFEVMTGSTLPNGADTVIRYEDVIIKKGTATITVDSISEKQNVHLKGKDRKQDDILIRKNTLISSAEIGVLATVGRSTVTVAKQPRVMIVSTGDELVEVAQKPLDYQIRRSNVYTLISLLKSVGLEAENDHILDNKEVLKTKIESYLQNYDVLLFSGAVSKGKYDFLPEVLEELGVEKLFHKVAQRPGKPFWYGMKDALSISDRNGKEAKKVSVFAFPGNPVSTFVGCLKYFFPWYKVSVGLSHPLPTAILTEDFEFKPQLTHFLQVKLSYRNGSIFATPHVGHGSGDLANLADVDGFLELPADKLEFKQGEIYPLIKYRA